MTKEQAIYDFVERLNEIPQEWVHIVMEERTEYHSLPMWGTMWFIDSTWGEKLMSNARRMVYSPSEIDVREAKTDEERETLEKAIKEKDWSILCKYVDEEMDGEMCILDKNGNTTALFIYEIEGEYLIGVNGEGWDFYHGVWDKLYETLDLGWHDEHEVNIAR
jgi:hypothetical protein